MDQRLAVALMALVAGSCVQSRSLLNRKMNPADPFGLDGPTGRVSPFGGPGGPNGGTGSPWGGPGGPNGGTGGPWGGPGGPHGAPPGHTNRSDPSTSDIQGPLCTMAIAPSEEQTQQMLEVADTCIAAQDGLQEIIDGLASDISGDFLGVAAALEEEGYPSQATELRQCVFTEMDMINSDGTFDMDTLVADILNKATGLVIEANIELGLENCPYVEEFDVLEFLQCVMTYCAGE